MTDTAEPHDVDATVAWLDDITDPLERYARATSEQTYHDDVADRLTRYRAASMAEMHRDGLTYARIAEHTELTRARVQQLVERGRDVNL